jgi:thymidylate synthase
MNMISAQKRHPEYQYLYLLDDIVKNGHEKKDHNTGMPFRSVFGRQIRFNLQEGFPLLTTKKVYWHGVLHELFWFLSGQSNIKYLVDRNIHIWDDYPYKIFAKAADEGKTDTLTKDEFVERIKSDAAFAAQWGELPFIYGQQWRRWPAQQGRTIDQIKWVIDTLKHYPDRRHAVVSVWNPQHLYAMALPGKALSFPLCHIFFHFNVLDGKLSCQLYQRSADMFLGVPFNIASYTLLTHIIAHLTGYQPGEFIHTFGDAHIYTNHIEQVREQMHRTPRPFPRISINDHIHELDSLQPEHVTLLDYNPHPPIKGELTVAGGFDEKDRKLFASPA